MADSIRVNGITIAYLVAGDPGAAPMVLLHGGRGEAAGWAEVLPELARDHRAYALDLRGYGNSDRPGEYSFELMRDDVIALIETLGLGPVVLIGHSMGGNVAWLLAQQRPDLVRRLVIEDVAPPRPGEPRISFPAAPAEPTPFDYQALASVVAQLNDPDPAWTDRLGAIAVPTLIVAGGSASHVDQDYLAELAERLPDGRLVTIPVGHGVHVDAPDEFVTAVRAFLAG